MPKQLIKTREEILGAIFLAHQIKNDKRFIDSFEEGEGIAHQYLENLTLGKNFVSKSSFGRFFNFINEPKISYDTLNKIVSWYFKGDYKNFRTYLKHHQEITTSKIISKEELSTLLQKTEGKKIHETIPDKKEEDSNRPISIIIENTIKQNRLYVVVVIGLIVSAITISAFYFNTEKSKQPAIKIDQININNKVYPTKESEFFSPQGEPMLWYANNTNEIDFFNQAGNHPMTKEKLKPVTREIVRTYLKKEKVTQPIIKETTYKTSVDILNKGKLDEVISIYFKNNYKSSMPVYQCKGTINYIFSKSSLSEKLFLCDIELSYNISSVYEGSDTQSNIIKTRGSGLTQQEAKQRAIEKIEF